MGVDALYLQAQVFPECSGVMKAQHMEMKGSVYGGGRKVRVSGGSIKASLWRHSLHNGRSTDGRRVRGPRAGFEKGATAH